ncbi:hypothetical protein WL21_17160 [Burkholderia ubonensis]|uniref:hypothetical protein n=1 Tax=Burkholderia ubonensis TaxID=101571 RepID=UPI000758AA59|nr:hypothetical protein [Burkholderia ubonensis]KVO89015.1 hypothetical protein WJ81_14205 [Burkholderia ubonensis]KVZ64095.1 hypothetical protein WL20_13460 [Burkholderia ubonensis]KVZ67053.1 hypothetical protein WL21_17160 [Burkholderia ubonensis]
MTGFQREVRSVPRTPEEIATERFEQSPVGRLIAEIREYAQGRKTDIKRGAESAALASLMVEKYGHGLMKAADVLALADSHPLTAEVDRLVVEIDLQHRKHQQYRWESRPASLSITDADGTNARVV